MATDPEVLRKYTAGYSQCAAEVSRYLAKLEGFSPDVRNRLVNHLTSQVHKVSNSPAMQPPFTYAVQRQGLMQQQLHQYQGMLQPALIQSIPHQILQESPPYQSLLQPQMSKITNIQPKNLTQIPSSSTSIPPDQPVNCGPLGQVSGSLQCSQESTLSQSLLPTQLPTGPNLQALNMTHTPLLVPSTLNIVPDQPLSFQTVQPADLDQQTSVSSGVVQSMPSLGNAPMMLLPAKLPSGDTIYILAPTAGTNALADIVGPSVSAGGSCPSSSNRGSVTTATITCPSSASPPITCQVTQPAGTTTTTQYTRSAEPVPTTNISPITSTGPINSDSYIISTSPTYSIPFTSPIPFTSSMSSTSSIHSTASIAAVPPRVHIHDERNSPNIQIIEPESPQSLPLHRVRSVDDSSSPPRVLQLKPTEDLQPAHLNLRLKNIRPDEFPQQKSLSQHHHKLRPDDNAHPTPSSQPRCGVQTYSNSMILAGSQQRGKKFSTTSSNLPLPRVFSSQVMVGTSKDIVAGTEVCDTTAALESAFLPPQGQLRDSVPDHNNNDTVGDAARVPSTGFVAPAATITVSEARHSEPDDEDSDTSKRYIVPEDMKGGDNDENLGPMWRPW